MTKDEVKKLLANLAEDYGTDVDQRMLDTWARHLADKDSEKVIRAYNQYFEDDQKGKAPTISQICSILKTISPRREYIYSERPELHWNKFGELEDENGNTYADPNWTQEDYEQHKLLYGGWQTGGWNEDTNIG